MKFIKRTWPWLAICFILAVELALPAGHIVQPVSGATKRDWNSSSFWHPNWGASGSHKGIDIFARHGTPVVAAQSSLVLYAGTLKRGGNVILAITPRGWLHYYAHLDTIKTHAGNSLPAGATIGTVGTSGNAAGKPPHLHYSVLSLVPRPWEIRWCAEGWKRMFYRDPNNLFAGTGAL